jgi:hypothetical protein
MFLRNTLLPPSILKAEAECSSEMLVCIYQSTSCHKPKCYKTKLYTIDYTNQVASALSRISIGCSNRYFEDFLTVIMEILGL